MRIDSLSKGAPVRQVSPAKPRAKTFAPLTAGIHAPRPEPRPEISTIAVDHLESNREISRLLIGWDVDPTVVAAALLLGTPADQVQDTGLKRVLENFYELENHHCDYSDPEQISNLRGLLLQRADSLDNLLLLAAKDLADLTNMRPQTPEQTWRSYRVTSWILNNYGHKKEGEDLEDLGLRHADPEKYFAIEQRVEQAIGTSRHDSLVKLSQIQREISDLLTAHGIEHTMMYRVKKLGSALAKEARGRPKLDINGIRLILHSDQSSDCYRAYYLIKYFLEGELKEYPPITGGLWEEFEPERDDYIENPKSNGYQSLQSIFNDLESWPLELQIRTRAMHYLAERGAASHNAYKDDVENIVPLAGETMADLQAGLSFKVELMRENGVFFLYDNDGNLHKLVTGIRESAPTIVDFAFTLGISAGLSVVSGKVNGRSFSLQNPLLSGQRVDLTLGNITRGQAKQRIKLTHTPLAKAILAAQARGQISTTTLPREKALIAEGKRLFQAALIEFEKSARQFLNNPIAEPTLVFPLAWICRRMGFANENEFYITFALSTERDFLLEKTKRQLLENLVVTAIREDKRTISMQLSASNRQGVIMQTLRLMGQIGLRLFSLRYDEPDQGNRCTIQLILRKTSGENPDRKTIKEVLEKLYENISPLHPKYGKMVKIGIKMEKKDATNANFALILREVKGLRLNVKAAQIPRQTDGGEFWSEFVLQIPRQAKRPADQPRKARKIKSKATPVIEVLKTRLETLGIAIDIREEEIVS